MVGIQSGEWIKTLAVAVLVALAGASLWWWLNRPADITIAVGEHRLLMVLPVQNQTGDLNNDFLSYGLTELLIDTLTPLDPARLAVVGKTSTAYFKAHPQDVRSTAHRYGANYLLESSIRIEQDIVHFSAVLVDTIRRNPVWSTTSAIPRPDFISQLDQLVSGKLSDLGQQLLGTVPAKLAVDLPVASRDRFAYLQAQFMARQPDARQRTAAALAFRQIMQRNPDFIPARIELVDLFLLSSQKGAMDQARKLLEEALVIDPQSVPARSRLAEILATMDWEFADAGTIFEQLAVTGQLTPRSRQAYAMVLMLTGKNKQALEQLRFASRQEPMSAALQAELGWYYYLDRRFDSALNECRKALSIDSNNAKAARCVLDSHLQKDDIEQAAQAALRLARISSVRVDEAPRHPPAAVIDWFNHQELERLKTAEQTGQAAVWRAITYARLEDHRKTLNALEQALEQRDGFLPFISLLPEFDFVRQEPKFMNIIDAVALGH